MFAQNGVLFIVRTHARAHTDTHTHTHTQACIYARTPKCIHEHAHTIYSSISGDIRSFVHPHFCSPSLHPQIHGFKSEVHPSIHPSIHPSCHPPPPTLSCRYLTDEAIPNVSRVLSRCRSWSMRTEQTRTDNVSTDPLLSAMQKRSQVTWLSRGYNHLYYNTVSLNWLRVNTGPVGSRSVSIVSRSGQLYTYMRALVCLSSYNATTKRCVLETGP